MKTLMLRVCYLGLAVSTILASPGNEEPTQTTDPVADVLPDLKIADADALAESEVPAPLVLAAAIGDTNAPPRTNAPAKPVIPVQEPIAPPNVNLSPAMAEVVKLVQAGVGPDVLMAYITNSTSVFNVDSDVILYLNDLGVTNTVITALIQHDSSPEAAARKASAAATHPLPPGVAVTSPATNVYPAPARPFPTPGQTTYPGDFSSVTDTNAVADPGNGAPPVVTAPLAGENVTVNHFYSSLAPYGSWVDVDGYGLCWRPTVAVADPYWQPYSDRGRWLWSDRGWYWYSDYSWGWAPFHYGRWCSYPRLGWIWVPGSVWAPSWVTWRYYDGYCGWAPLPPGCGFRSGIGLTWYGRGITVGFDFGLGSHCWSYVPVSRFCDWNVRRHCLPANRLHVVHKAAVPVNRFERRNNNIVNHGIEPNTIARASRTKIPTMKVKDHALPADGRDRPERLDPRANTIAVARPQLSKGQSAVAAPVAARGTATKARPMTLNANAAQAAAPTTVNRQGLTPPNSSSSLRPPAANNNRPGTVATANQPGERVQPNRPSTTQQPVNRSTPQATTPNVQRQGPGPIARNNVNPNPTPNAAPVGRALAPPQAAPRSAPQQVAPPRTAPPQTAPRPAPQTAPAPRSGGSPMIRSYAQPQVSAPRAAAPAPSIRQAPMASPQPSLRPSTPSFQAPRQHSLAPPSVRSAPSAPSVSRSAPSVSRSAPSGGGGGGGGRSGGGGGGGRNRGD